MYTKKKYKEKGVVILERINPDREPIKDHDKFIIKMDSVIQHLKKGNIDYSFTTKKHSFFTSFLTLLSTYTASTKFLNAYDVQIKILNNFIEIYDLFISTNIGDIDIYYQPHEEKKIILTFDKAYKRYEKHFERGTTNSKDAMKCINRILCEPQKQEKYEHFDIIAQIISQNIYDEYSRSIEKTYLNILYSFLEKIVFELSSIYGYNVENNPLMKYSQYRYSSKIYTASESYKLYASNVRKYICIHMIPDLSNITMEYLFGDNVKNKE